MKIFFVIDETSFYHPNFLAKFIEKTNDEVVGIGIVTKVPKKNNIQKYLINHFYYLKISEILKLFFKRFSNWIKNIFVRPCTDGNFYSVKKVADYYNIFNFDIENNINNKVYLLNIKKTNPDIIISSNSLYFGKTLLNIPKICCINRHSALLPSYGGLWPVFQAVRSGEKFVGASIHTMERKIDKGIILSQIKIKIEKEDTVSSLYKKCFEKSVDALLIALEKISRNDFSSIENNYSSSYYSFPTNIQWMEFRKRGCKFI